MKSLSSQSDAKEMYVLWRTINFGFTMAHFSEMLEYCALSMYGKDGIMEVASLRAKNGYLVQGA